jgi:hypothetical protein
MRLKRPEKLDILKRFQKILRENSVLIGREVYHGAWGLLEASFYRAHFWN